MNSGLNSYFKQVVSGNEDPDPYRRFMDSNRVLEHLFSLTVVGEKSYVTVILENGSYYMNYSVSDYNPLDYEAAALVQPNFGLQGLESLWTEPEATMFLPDQIDHPTQPIGGAHAPAAGFRDIRLRNRNVHGGSDQRDLQLPSEGNDMVPLDAKGTIVSGSYQNQIGTTFAYLDELDQDKPYSIVPMKGRNS